MPLEVEGHEPPILVPGQKFGQFIVVEEIGSGGMGQVYKVRHTTFEDDFALKILHSDIIRDPAAMTRLKNEARTGYRLKHQNVVGIDEFNEAEGRFYIRMPLMRGFKVGGQTAVSLKEVIKQNGGRLQEGDAAIILRDILSGLAFAHKEKVVHRDLKPANILFNGQIALISDFGLVRIVGEEFFRSKLETIALSKMPSSSASSGSAALIGTYNFMAPEQRMAKEADLRSDVYAIGLIALNMITGSPNFGMKAPSKTLKGLSRDWDDFLAKALEQDPADRFQNGGEMLDAMPRIDVPPTVLTERASPIAHRKIVVAKSRSKKPLVIAAVAALAVVASGAAAILISSSHKGSQTAAKVEDHTLQNPAPQENTASANTAAATSVPAAQTPVAAPEVKLSPIPAPEAPQAAAPAANVETAVQTPKPSATTAAEPAAAPIVKPAETVAQPSTAPKISQPPAIEPAAYPSKPVASAPTAASEQTTTTAPKVSQPAVSEQTPAVSAKNEKPVQETPRPVSELKPSAAAPANVAATPGPASAQPAVAVAQPVAPVAQPVPAASPVVPTAPVDKTWLVVYLPGGETMKLRRIEPGKFMYGSRTEEVGRTPTREVVQREAVIAKPFYIGQFEVTQRQFEAVAGRNPSHFRSADNPVEQVSFQSLVRQAGFFDALNNILSSTGHENLKARLPTEEEWEYACRAGSNASYYDGSDLGDASQTGSVPNIAVCGKLYYGTSMTQKVGSLAPNKWDLFDMSGNVDEMTDKGVLRGGSWASTARDCRSAARKPMGVNFRGDDKTGFRVVIDDLDDR